MRKVGRILSWLFCGQCLLYIPFGLLMCVVSVGFFVKHVGFTMGQALIFPGALFFLGWGLLALNAWVEARRSRRRDERRAREVNRALSHPR